MFPVLLTIGKFHIYSHSVFLVFTWLVFSFLFWRKLRNEGVDEDKIFDLMFYASVAGFITARALYVILFWEFFKDSVLRIFALWIQPGFSLYGALLGILITLIFLSRKAKIRLGAVLDAFAVAFPAAMAVGLIGSFLDGSTTGRISTLPWAVRYVGSVGRRHPVQIYELLVLIILVIILHFLSVKSNRGKWPYGLVSIWFFLLYAFFMFPLEFMKESHVYWTLSANQWILIALFAEAIGAFYVRGGGREIIRPLPHKLKLFFVHLAGGIYAKFSKQRS